MGTSLRYKILKTGIGMMGTKKMFALSTDELLQKVSHYNEKRGFRIPTDSKCLYGDKVILENYHCLTMQIGERKAKRAILFFFGRGMLIGPDEGDIKTALRFGKKSRRGCMVSLLTVVYRSLHP